MTASDLVYPVLFLYKDSLCGARTEQFLTTTTAAAFRAGFFSGLRVIDSNGRQYTVTKARRLHGVGAFWCRVLLNRTVRVAIDLCESGEALDVEEVRRLVLREFENWHGWETRDDFDGLRRGVERASTVSEIIRLVTS